MMRRIVSSVAAGALLWAGPVAAQVDPGGLEALRAMADAVRQARSLAFSVSLRGQGGFMGMLPDIRGDVVMARHPERPEQWRFRVTGVRGEAMGSPALEFLVVGLGPMRTWIDHDVKIVYERPVDQARNEQVTVTELLIPRELLASEPFASALAAPTIATEPPVTLDGVECDVVNVDLGAQVSPNRYRWAIARTDRLPRRIVAVYAGQDLEMSQVWTLRNVRVNEPVSDADLTIALPGGYSFSAAPAPEQMRSPTAVTSSPWPATRSVGLQPGEEAPNTDLVLADGTTITLGSLRGQAVVLFFFGSWSPPSHAAAEALARVMEVFRTAQVKVVALATRERDAEAPAAFLRDKGLAGALLVPKAEGLAKTFKIRVYPTFFVLGREGQVVWTQAGPTDDLGPTLQTAVDCALTGRPFAPAAVGKPTSQGGSGDAGGGSDAPRP